MSRTFFIWRAAAQAAAGSSAGGGGEEEGGEGTCGVNIGWWVEHLNCLFTALHQS